MIHWEQLVYLAIWKDLNKGKIWTKRKEKNKEIGLYHRKREDGQAFAFWRLPSSAFAPSALRPCLYSMYRRADNMQNRFPVIWTILNSLRAFHHLRIISDHFGLIWSILNKLFLKYVITDSSLTPIDFYWLSTDLQWSPTTCPDRLKQFGTVKPKPVSWNQTYLKSSTET